MRALSLTIGIVAAVLLGGSSSIAQASSHIAYQIHEVPDDPNSPIVFTVTLKIEEVDREGDLVGWEVLEARFERTENTTRVWMKTVPFVATSDGLWWIEHADPNNPTIGEFVLPPEMSGTAPALGSVDPDLDFLFSGVAWDPEVLGSPYAVTGGLSYSFTLVGESEPLEEGENGPVEVEPTPQH
jgi:hypothetical protein